jgi:hypothetical protein
VTRTEFAASQRALAAASILLERPAQASPATTAKPLRADGRESAPAAILRDASLRDEPWDQVRVSLERTTMDSQVPKRTRSPWFETALKQRLLTMRIPGGEQDILSIVV